MQILVHQLLNKNCTYLRQSARFWGVRRAKGFLIFIEDRHVPSNATRSLRSSRRRLKKYDAPGVEP